MTGYRFIVAFGLIRSISECLTIPRCSTSAACRSVTIWLNAFVRVNGGLVAQGFFVKTGLVVDATTMSPRSSAKNRYGKRHPAMS